MDVSLKHPFSMLASEGRDVGKTEFTKKLLKSRLIAPPPERSVWCHVKHQQDLFKELMKMNVEYAEGIPGELDKYLKKNKRNLIILDGLMDEASKSLKVTQLFTRGRHDNHKTCFIKINALLVLIPITWRFSRNPREIPYVGRQRYSIISAFLLDA